MTNLTVPQNRLTDALGATDMRGWLTPVWQSLLVGAAFVAVALAGFHDPQAAVSPSTSPAPLLR